MARKSKYQDMPEPPCGAIKRSYNECLVERRKWRAYHKQIEKRAPRTMVVGPYIEENGRIMEGCLVGPTTEVAAQRFLRGRYDQLMKSSLMMGYSSGPLLDAMLERTRIVHGTTCPPERKAEGLPIQYWGTVADMFTKGASLEERRKRRLPDLYGLPARKRR
jgi:hypothetical protein